MPAGVASGWNEIKQHREVSRIHFPRVATLQIPLNINEVYVLGNSGGAVWDCRPCVCYPAGGMVEKSDKEDLFLRIR